MHKIWSYPNLRGFFYIIRYIFKVKYIKKLTLYDDFSLS